MLVRCERCRAVYQLDTRVAQGVQCVRCQLVFMAREPASLGAQGVLGGAAAQAVAASPRLRVVALPPQRSSVRWVAAALVVAAAVGGGLAWRAHLKRIPVVGPSPLALIKTTAGEDLVWHDDTASLESAIAAFSEAESIDPSTDGPVAERALATLLLSLSLREQEQDLTVELATLQAEQATPSPPETVAARAERSAALRHLLPSVASRAATFLKEGLALSERVQDPTGLLLAVVARTRLLADALQRRHSSPATTTAEWRPARPLEPGADAWRALVAGLARIADNPQPADWLAAQSQFDMAARMAPRFIRAKWELARACLASTPPDITRAKAAIDAILQLNPQHDGAQRLLGVILAAQQPPPPPTGTPSTEPAAAAKPQ